MHRVRLAHGREDALGHLLEHILLGERVSALAIGAGCRGAAAARSPAVLADAEARKARLVAHGRGPCRGRLYYPYPRVTLVPCRHARAASRKVKDLEVAALVAGIDATKARVKVHGVDRRRRDELCDGFGDKARAGAKGPL